MKQIAQSFLIKLLFIVSLSTQAFALSLPLRGIWNSKCESEGLLYKFISIEIHEDVWTQTTWWTNDKRCKNITLEQQIMFSFTLNADVWAGKALMACLRPYTKAEAELFNQQNLCGHSNWKRGRVIEITNLNCENFLIPKYDETSRAAVKIEGPRNNMLWLDGVLYLLDPSGF